MTLKPARLLLALIAVAALPAFAQNVAHVNGKAIPTARVDAIVSQVVAKGQRPDSKELRDSIKDDLIVREVMMQAALKQGFDKDPTVKEQLGAARETLVVQAMMQEYAAKNPVTEAEIKAEYDRYKSQAGDKEYRVRHILFATDAEAKAAIAKLKGGAKFDELAKASKDEGTANTGGLLDYWASPADFPKPFSDGFVALQKGGVSATPVQTENGFHVLKLDDSRPAQLIPFEEAKPRIVQGLLKNKVLAYQDMLVKKATVK
ncbi:MAG: peptidyl-prolyl cis-trans isomerase [Pseudomonadota bacterium]